MHILVTGAGGFIGRHLVKQLLADTGRFNTAMVTAVDLNLEHLDEADRLTRISGSFADADVLDQALDGHPADLVFHLASVPSGLAESNFALGVDVNIHGTLALLDRLRDQGNRPAVVFASSIAVYGKPAVAEVDDDTLPTPNLSYGAQKVIGETLVADYTRREWIKGCSVRLPGIVARPPEPNGAVSIFFSDLIRCLSRGEPFTCPVSSGARSWLMSIGCVVDNLLHAATLDPGERHTWTLPALHISIEELVGEIAALFPRHNAGSLIAYAPNPWVEENFGSYPPIHCPKAEAAGFHHDGSAMTLVKEALAGLD